MKKRLKLTDRINNRKLNASAQDRSSPGGILNRVGTLSSPNLPPAQDRSSPGGTLNRVGLSSPNLPPAQDRSSSGGILNRVGTLSSPNLPPAQDRSSLGGIFNRVGTLSSPNQPPAQDRSSPGDTLNRVGTLSSSNLQNSSSGSRQSTNTSSDRNASRAVKLIVEPFQFISFLQWDCVQAFNNHGTLTIKGLVAEENRMKYVDMATRETWVCAKAIGENDEEIILFQGVLTNLTVDSIHQHHTMSIEIKTGTYLLDQTLHTRTFQPDGMTFQNVINTCIQAAGGQFIMRERQGATTGQLTVQYQESDFAFISRLAHRLGVVVLPEIKTQGKRVLLGLVQNAREGVLISDSYTMSNSSPDMDSLIRYEHGVYHVRTRDIYELGQAVIFQGRRLSVSKVESFLEGSELMHKYTLCMLKSAYERPQPHDQIQGVSMRARVTAVERARVQVQIHEDENRRQSGRRWFDYATVYSSPDGTGWFAQPEIGDEVRLIFPNANESGAYVSSSVHLESGGRTNPANKSWKNKQNKEILFTPNSLTLTNNGGLSIELDDSKGITINSNRGIFIESDGQLSLNSDNAGITVYGDRSVTIMQGAAQIRLKDAIDIAGGKINMN